MEGGVSGSYVGLRGVSGSYVGLSDKEGEVSGSYDGLGDDEGGSWNEISAENYDRTPADGLRTNDGVQEWKVLVVLRYVTTCLSIFVFFFLLVYRGTEGSLLVYPLKLNKKIFLNCRKIFFETKNILASSGGHLSKPVQGSFFFLF